MLYYGKKQLLIRRFIMEHHLKIDNLGSIKHCSLDVNNDTVLTGYQASGKSTFAKVINADVG